MDFQEVELEGIDWIYWAENWNQGQALVNLVIASGSVNLRISQAAE
jgi:hypothetical protein